MEKNRSFLTYVSLIIIFILFIGVLVYPGEKRIHQPIQYSHTIHVDSLELDCIECHVYYEEFPSATLPTLEICQNCHGDELQSESPEEKILVGYIERNEEVPWKRIYRVPDHVYFSHRRHVVLGELECTTCHGNVSALNVPAPAPLVPIKMTLCIECHKKHNVSTDCLACHR